MKKFPPPEAAPRALFSLAKMPKMKIQVFRKEKGGDAHGRTAAKNHTDEYRKDQ